METDGKQTQNTGGAEMNGLKELRQRHPSLMENGLRSVKTADIIPAMQPKQLPKKPYAKSPAVLELERLAMDEAKILHPSCPALAKRSFRDDKSNSLTQCIVKYVTLKGGFASRINNGGNYNTKLRRFIPGTSRKGLADVMATYQGKSLHIEIKTGKDRQSEAQRKIEAEVILSGGYYVLASNFTDFKTWFDSLAK
jgi:hypothetical protein